MMALALSLMLSASEPAAPAVTEPPEPELAEWNRERTRVNRAGMWVLTGWAAANIVGGAIGAPLARDDQTRFFHLGNLLWNTVNAVLGVTGLINNWKPGDVNAKEALVGSQRDVTLFLVNAGLDVGYLAAAGFLWQRGDAERDPRLVGLGQALLVQGGFLLVFDVVMGLLNMRLTSRLLEKVSIAVTPAGVSGTF